MSGNPNSGRFDAVVRTVELPPDPRVTEALGLQHSIETALADIVDNSIEAGAGSVWIRFVVADDVVERIIIADDGSGMGAGKLEESLRLGARRDYDSGALGMYGIGMKASAFSLADALTVATRLEGAAASAMTTPRSQGDNSFVAYVHSSEDADARLASLEVPFSIEHGTIVDLRSIRGASTDRDGAVRRAWLSDRIRRLRNHFGLVFHRFLDSGRLRLTIDVFDRAVGAAGVPFHPVSIDPFRPATGKLGYPRTLTVDLPEGQTTTIICHILAPGIKTSDARIFSEDRADWQGIFVYRNDRLLRLGGWSEVTAKKSDTQLARALLEITPESLRWFGMNAEKNGVALSPELTRSIQSAGDEDVSFKDFLQDARDVMRQANRREQTLKPIAAMGSGLPEAVEEVAGETFGFREHEKSVNVRWETFPVGRLFVVDHERATIWINERHRAALKAGAPDDEHGVIKTMLFLLFEGHFSKAGIQQITRDRIQAIEAMIGAAIGVPITVERVTDVMNPQLEMPIPVPLSPPDDGEASPRHESEDAEAEQDSDDGLSDDNDLSETETPPVNEWRSDSIRQYMDVVGRHPLLRADEEVSIARRIEAGVLAQERLDAMEVAERRTMEGRELAWVARDGLRARDKMVASNLRLVISIAKRYQHHGMELLDLIQEGNAGLVHAVEKFDYTRGLKFSTYATWWIRQAITRALADKGSAIRMPVHMTEFGKRIGAERSKLSATLDRTPTDAEVADALGEDAEKVSLYIRMSRPLYSLNAPLVVVEGEEEDDLEMDEYGAAQQTVVEFGAVIEDEYDMVEAALAHSMLSSQIESVLSKLGERESTVIRMRFGIGDDEPMTLDKIGEIFGVTRERIRQIEAKALKTLRSPRIMEALGMTPPPVAAAVSASVPNPVGPTEHTMSVAADSVHGLLQAYTQLRHVRSAAALAGFTDRDAAIALTRMLMWESGPIDDSAAALNHGASWEPAEIDRVTAAYSASVPLTLIAESTGRTQLAVAWRLLDNTSAPVVVPDEFESLEAVAATWSEVVRRMEGPDSTEAGAAMAS